MTADKKSRIIRNQIDLNRAVNAINNLPLDKPLKITVEHYKAPKSDSQRGFFHILMDVWSQETGIPPGHLKEFCKGELFGWRVVRIGKIEFPVADGSSEQLSKMGYSELIETAYRLAAESGVILPEPNRFAA